MFKTFFRRSDTPTRMINMTVAELKQKLDANEPLILLDVRTPEEYALDGHIAGSRLLPLPMVQTRSSELPANTPIICICRSGNRSQAACDILRQHGFSQPINLTGGIMAWKRAGFPTNGRLSTTTPAIR